MYRKILIILVMLIMLIQPCLCRSAFASTVSTYDCKCTDIHWHVLPTASNNGCYEPICDKDHIHDYTFYSCFDRDNPICGKESKLHELGCLSEDWLNSLENYNYIENKTLSKLGIPVPQNMPYIYASITTYQASNHRVYDVASDKLSNLQLMVLGNVNGYKGDDLWRTLPENTRYLSGVQQYNWVPAYCADKQHDAQRYFMYKQVNVEDSTYFDKAAAEKIRAVMMNSYPYYTMEEMQDRLSDAGFRDAELFDEAVMISATQLAIWNFSNEYDYPETHPEPYKTRWVYNHTEAKNRCSLTAHAPVYNADKQKYYMPQVKDRIARMTEYLVKTANDNPQQVGEDQIVITRAYVTDLSTETSLNDKQQVTLWVGFNTPLRAYKTAEEQAELTVTATSESGATASKTMTSGQDCEIVLENYQQGDAIDVTVEGQQFLTRGVYFYEPDLDETTDANVRSYSQNLVGINSGLNPVAYSVKLAPTQLMLQKINHLGEPLTDAAFTLSYVHTETEAEKVLIDTYEVNDQGQILLDNLIGGATYELQEVRTPEGYDTLTTPVRFRVLPGPTPQIELEDNGLAAMKDGVLSITNHLSTSTSTATTTPASPATDTGDSATPLLWALLMVTSFMGLVLILYKRQLHS